jgi:hypothetical protein
MESKLVQTKDIGDLASETVCYFGSCTPAAALGTRLPSRDSLSVSLSVQARTQNHCRRT